MSSQNSSPNGENDESLERGREAADESL